MTDAVLFAILGLIFLVGGIVGVHKSRRTSPWYLRISAILLAGIGATSIWSAVAKTAPTLNDPEIVVMETSPDSLLVRVSAENVRNCKFDKAQIVASGTGSLVKSNLIYLEKTADGGYLHENYFIRVHVQNALEKEDSLKVSVGHICPLGIRIDTDIGEIKLTKR